MSEKNLSFVQSYNGIHAGCKCQGRKGNEHDENMLLVGVGIDRCSEAGSESGVIEI
jgi:hypothetical protein